MKAELKLYCCLGFLILLVLLFRIFSTGKDSVNQVSTVNEFCNFDQLVVELNCEIFFVEGENNRIVLEGPEKIIRNIETVHNEGSILIREKSSRILSGVIDFFNSRKSDLTIYVSVNSLKEMEVIPVEDLSNLKYASEELIGLSLKDGESVVIDSKKFKLSCI